MRDEELDQDDEDPWTWQQSQTMQMAWEKPDMRTGLLEIHSISPDTFRAFCIDRGYIKDDKEEEGGGEKGLLARLRAQSVAERLKVETKAATLVPETTSILTV